MCFKNLPIEVDAQGNAKLRPGAADPFAVTNSLRTPMKGHAARSDRFLDGTEPVRSLDVARDSHVVGDIAVDLQELLGLVEDGCPPDLAVRIAAPIDWPSASH